MIYRTDETLDSRNYSIFISQKEFNMNKLSAGSDEKKKDSDKNKKPPKK